MIIFRPTFKFPGLLWTPSAFLSLFAMLGAAAAAADSSFFTLQDFESANSMASVWVVNIPNQNASVRLSADGPREGKQCLQLHYRFVGAGQFQYLGIPVKVRVESPVRRLSYWLKGDQSMCSYGIQIKDASGETHQYGKNTGQGGTVDFRGWKHIVISLDSPHETWGGDKNGKIDYPVDSVTFTVGQPAENGKLLPAEGDLSFDLLAASAVKPVEGRISVLSPEYCSEVKGDTKIVVSTPGFETVTAKCWRQGGVFGSDSTVATVALDAKGGGSFNFPADSYPHGPVTVRISGRNEDWRDNCYLQLYNAGGVSWNEGAPAGPPLAARGMSLVFADDFNGPLSISSSDFAAVYYDHKPPDGSQDFSTLRFTGYHEPNNPFKQLGTYLRIRASEPAGSSGLISSMRNNATGVTAQAPCYFECRFIAPNAPGAWPAFWLLSDYMTARLKGLKTPCDELDIIEAYGGEGEREPNAFDSYMITPHCWDQGGPGKAAEKSAFDAIRNPVRMRKLGVPSSWFETFHTYGCKITETETIYYCDNIEAGRHATLPLSKQSRFFFLVNLATGGGWPVDLSRYHGLADMYVDYVRVYQGKN